MVSLVTMTSARSAATNPSAAARSRRYFSERAPACVCAASGTTVVAHVVAQMTTSKSRIGRVEIGRDSAPAPE